MSTLSILIAPDPLLARKAKPVTQFSKKLEKFVESMFEIMHEAKGIGLAAMQVGKLENLFVIHIPAEEDAERKRDNCAEFGPLVMINPRILSKEGEQSIEEGCLSLPNIQAKVKRYSKIKVIYQDVKSKSHIVVLEGLASICVQHEMDHLNGILFINHLEKEKEDQFLQQLIQDKENEI